MINLFKLLWWKKPKLEQSDITQSEREEYDDYIEMLNFDIKCFRGTLDAQIIEISKLKGHVKRISFEADAQAAENNNLRLELAKKVTPKKRNKK
jgi:hypothetical protein